MNKCKNKPFLFLQSSTLESTVVQFNSWHTGAGIEWTGKKSCWLQEGKEVRAGRGEGLSATTAEGQAAVSLTPDVDGTPSGSLLDSILSTLLEKATQWFLGGIYFFFLSLIAQ